MKKDKILSYLPHRQPFLFVDDILCIEPNKKVIGVKNIGSNEMFLQEGIDEKMVFPSVLLIEVMAQISGFVFCDINSDESKTFYSYLSKAENIKVFERVHVGDCIVVEGRFISSFSNYSKVKCIAKVNDKKVAEGEITYYREQ